MSQPQLHSLTNSHSLTPSPYSIHEFGEISVQVIPSHSDNYSYLISERSGSLALVDVSDVPAVSKAVEWRINSLADSRLDWILSTHRHLDHCGGNEEFHKLFPKAEIVGSVSDSVPACSRFVSHGEILKFGDSTTIRIFEVPCHTRGHIVFLFETPSKSVLFGGDTIFISGCGRFFEGSASEMYKNLVKTIGEMPDESFLFPGHEYTVANLEFSQWVEPENSEIRNKSIWAKQQREEGKSTVPSTLGEEKLINPFMRVGNEKILPAIRERVKQYLPTENPESAISVLHALREAKNAGAHQKGN